MRLGINSPRIFALWITFCKKRENAAASPFSLSLFRIFQFLQEPTDHDEQRIMVVQIRQNQAAVKEIGNRFGRDNGQNGRNQANHEQDFHKPHDRAEQFIDRADQTDFIRYGIKHFFKNFQKQLGNDKEHDARDQRRRKLCRRLAHKHCQGRSRGHAARVIFQDSRNQDRGQILRFQQRFHVLPGNVDIEAAHFGKAFYPFFFQQLPHAEEPARKLHSAFGKAHRDKERENGGYKPEKAGDEPLFRTDEHEYEHNHRHDCVCDIAPRSCA